jgi:hypothetical protein
MTSGTTNDLKTKRTWRGSCSFSYTSNKGTAEMQISSSDFLTKESNVGKP